MVVFKEILILGKVLLILILVAVNLSCSWGVDDDELTMGRESYNLTDLKLDGYYYEDIGNNSINTYFLFQNGIILYGGGVGANGQPYEDWEERIKSGNFYNNEKKFKSSWGVFNINDKKITIERWVPPSPGTGVHAYRLTGVIQNETTFQITSSVRVNGENYSEVDWTYHFKAFSPKPDSICPFIP